MLENYTITMQLFNNIRKQITTTIIYLIHNKLSILFTININIKL